MAEAGRTPALDEVGGVLQSSCPEPPNGPDVKFQGVDTAGLGHLSNMLASYDLLKLLGDRADAALRAKNSAGGCVSERRTRAWVGLTSEIDPIRCSALSAGSASHSSTLILIRSGTENTAAPAGPNAADAGLAAATASSAALPVASVGISTARLVSVFPRRNGGG